MKLLKNTDHEVVTVARDTGKWFIKYGTTCELSCPAEWEETSKEKVMADVEGRINYWYS